MSTIREYHDRLEGKESQLWGTMKKQHTHMGTLLDLVDQLKLHISRPIHEANCYCDWCKRLKEWDAILEVVG